MNLQEAIENRAYQRYEFRLEHGISGTPEDDWLYAESSLGLFPPYVAIAAYFRSLWRMRSELLGTPESDWLWAQEVMFHDLHYLLFKK